MVGLLREFLGRTVRTEDAMTGYPSDVALTPMPFS
jgi:hypothetical protein